MAIHKIIEVSTKSDQGWEDAARKAVQQAAGTVKNIKSIYIQDMLADVENNKISAYQVIAKVTFEVEGK
jgi:hypothetical protein